MSFFGELGRRNVFRVGIAYAIVAWIVVQVADIVFETIGAPAWVMQTLMLGLVLGFFVALIFSWAYEVTPEGVKRESEVDRSQSITGHTARKLDRVITGLLVLALGYFIWESRIAGPDPVPTAEPIAVTTEDPVEATVTPISDLSIAVLPFDNRSNLADDEFFTEGMHDDLLTTLAKIGSMKVISRTSVMEYKETTKKIPEIAAELGVANILEGGVQRAGNQVRINVQLIDANTDEHLWAEIYDRELTAENLFAIQSEISRAIADALHATLSPEEERRIATAPTDNLEAFDHYLRGRQLMATRAVDELRLSTQEFLTAVEIDPEFALAWVGVADSHDLLSSYDDLPQGTFDNTRDDAINRALALDPNLGAAYASLGALLFDQGENEKAEEAHRRAIELSPNYATAWHWLGITIRQNYLRAAEALPYLVRAAELDPNSAVILTALGGNYGMTGDFEASKRYDNRLVEMHPEFSQGWSSLSYAILTEGDVAGSIDPLVRAIELDPGSADFRSYLAYTYATLGDLDRANQEASRLAELFPEDVVATLLRLDLDGLTARPADTRESLSEALDGKLNVDLAWRTMYSAFYLSEPDLALDAFEQTQIDIPADADSSVEFLGATMGSHCQLAWIFLETDGNAQLGQAVLDQAIDLYERGYADGISHLYRFDPQLCYLLSEDYDKSLDIIETQLKHRYFYNWRWDHNNSAYDAIREHPRYVAAWDEYERLMAEQLEMISAKDKAKPAFEF